MIDLKTITFLAVTIFLIAIAPRAADAIVNPESFKRGPEQIVIKVTNVTVKKLSMATIVHLLAEVVSVKRSATGLKPGDAILIRYQRHPATTTRHMDEMMQRGEKGWAGQQPFYQPHPPQIGDVISAFLRRLEGGHGRVYRPAAYQYSFEKAQ